MTGNTFSNRLFYLPMIYMYTTHIYICIYRWSCILSIGTCRIVVFFVNEKTRKSSESPHERATNAMYYCRDLIVQLLLVLYREKYELQRMRSNENIRRDFYKTRCSTPKALSETNREIYSYSREISLYPLWVGLRSIAPNNS